MVEFALVLPVFILLLFGLLDVGRYVYMNSVLSQAAREGARVAAAEASWIGKTISDDPSCVPSAALITGSTPARTSARPPSPGPPIACRLTWSPLPTAWSPRSVP